MDGAVGQLAQHLEAVAVIQGHVGVLQPGCQLIASRHSVKNCSGVITTR